MAKRAWAVVRPAAALVVWVGVVGCGPGTIGEVAEDAPAPIPAGESQVEGASLDVMFERAGVDFDVPVGLLKSIAWVETGAEMVEGEEEFEGRPASHGLMALRGAQLEEGAAYAGVTVDQAMTEPEANIRAAAALLSKLADAEGIERDEIGHWADVVVAYSGIEALGARAYYVHDQIYQVIREGVATEVLELEPLVDAAPMFPMMDGPASPGPDYAAANWQPSPNYSSRPSGSLGDPQMVIIHTCEGSYAGCWSWLKNSGSGVSAHYVVNTTGSEITQLVREHKKAWHIGAKYKCSLNDSTSCGLNGYSSNNFTVGIEHAGYAKQASWDSGLIHTSAKLVCDITKDQAIPRDKYHIVGHGQLQPYNRIDPGPNWPWADYLGLVNDYCGTSPPPEDPPQDPPEDPPEDTPADDPNPPSGDFDVVVDSNNALNGANAACDVSSSWTASKNVSGYYETGYWWRSTGSSSDLASFKVHLTQAKTVTVYAWWSAASDRATKAPFLIFDGDGVQLDVVYVNQQNNGGQWVALGTYELTAGWNTVGLSRWTTPGAVVVADAVRFVEVP